MSASYDIGIIGGGLAGLSLAILQAQAGKKVILFEKGTYPSHKVCGEYISNESWAFVESLGIPLSTLQLPTIYKLQVSSPLGTLLSADLDLGGFGISRYKLDQLLALKARELGVLILENTQVTNVSQNDKTTEIESNKAHYVVLTCVGAFGKRSNLDIQWARPFIQRTRTGLNQYIGVKYHIEYDFPKDLIALHNFKDGYCGISAIEENKYCLCYLTTKANLNRANNDIKQMEKEVLWSNPFLKEIFQNAKIIFEKPVVISQISFEKKEQSLNGLPFIGDAASMIAPLCGNGMSMAMHSSKILHHALMENTLQNYYQKWEELFSLRLRIGRILQSIFGGIISTEIVIRLLKTQPSLLKKLIGLTHGKPF